MPTAGSLFTAAVPCPDLSALRVASAGIAFLKQVRLLPHKQRHPSRAPAAPFRSLFLQQMGVQAGEER